MHTQASCFLYTVKKITDISVPIWDVTYQTPSGEKNLIIPAQWEFGKWHPSLGDGNVAILFLPCTWEYSLLFDVHLFSPIPPLFTLVQPLLEHSGQPPCLIEVSHSLPEVSHSLPEVSHTLFPRSTLSYPWSAFLYEVSLTFNLYLSESASLYLYKNLFCTHGQPFCLLSAGNQWPNWPYLSNLGQPLSLSLYVQSASIST